MQPSEKPTTKLGSHFEKKVEEEKQALVQPNGEENDDNKKKKKLTKQELIEKTLSLLKFWGIVVLFISIIAIIIIIAYFYNGFKEFVKEQMGNYLLFMGINGAISFMGLMGARQFGVALGEELDEYIKVKTAYDKMIVKEKIKKKRDPSFLRTQILGALSTLLTKGIFLVGSCVGIVWVAIEGTKDTTYLVSGIMTILMTLASSVLQVNSGYSALKDVKIQQMKLAMERIGVDTTQEEININVENEDSQNIIEDDVYIDIEVVKD